MNISKRVDNLFGFYYGWIIVAVSLISMAFWFGVRSSFSVFYVALLEDFAWNRGESAGVQSMAMISYTILAPLVGGLIDRFGPRRVILPGILLLSLGLVLCATIETLTQFYFFYGVLVGSGVTCIGVVSYTAILAHWFEKKRGLASGIAVSGVGLGICFWVPLSQYFITTLGWLSTFMVFGVLVIIILFPLNTIFLRHKPQELGQRVDGVNGEEHRNEAYSSPTDSSMAANDWTISKTLRSGRFWALMTFTFLSVFGMYVIVVHNIKFLVDQGIDKMEAAFIFAMVGVVSSIFRIFWGWLSDRIGREITFTMGMFFGCMGVMSLILFEKMGLKGFVYTFFIFFGIGWGVTAPIIMSVSADIFRGRVFGLTYGIVEGGIGVAGALGAWVPGFLFDRSQSYQSTFILIIILMIISCFFIWLAAPRKIHHGS